MESLPQNQEKDIILLEDFINFSELSDHGLDQEKKDENFEMTQQEIESIE